MSAPPTENNNNTNIPSEDSATGQENSMSVWFTGKVMANRQFLPNVQTLPQGYPQTYPNWNPIWNHTPPPPPLPPQNQGPINFHQYLTNSGIPSGPWKVAGYPNLEFYPKEEDFFDKDIIYQEPHRPMDYTSFPKQPPVNKQSLTNLHNPNYQNPQRVMNYPNPSLYPGNNRVNFFDVPEASTQLPIKVPNLVYPLNPNTDVNPKYFGAAIPNSDYPQRRMDDPNHQFMCPPNCRRHQMNFFDTNYPMGAKPGTMPNPGYSQWPMDYPNPSLYPPRQPNFFEMNKQVWDMPNPMEYPPLPDVNNNYEQKCGFTQDGPFYPNHPFQYPQRQVPPPNPFQERNWAQLPQQRFQRSFYCRPNCPFYDQTPQIKFHYNVSTSTNDMPESSGAAFDCSLVGKVYYREKPKPLEKDNSRGLTLRQADIAAALATQGTQSDNAKRLILSKPPPKSDERKDAADEHQVQEANYEESTSGEKSEKKQPVKNRKKRRSHKKKICTNDDCSSSSGSSDSER